MGRTGTAEGRSLACSIGYLRGPTRVFRRRPRGANARWGGALDRRSTYASCAIDLALPGPVARHRAGFPLADYGLQNAMLPSIAAGVRLLRILILSYATATTLAQRDSIVLAERLELAGGYRIGD